MQLTEIGIPILIDRKDFEENVNLYFFEHVLKVTWIQSDTFYHKYNVHYIYPQDLIKLGSLREKLLNQLN